MIDADLLGAFLFELSGSFGGENACGIDVAKLLLEVRQIVVWRALHGQRGEVFAQLLQLLLQDFHILQEIGLVELLQAVLLSGNLLGRLQDREAVLSNEGVFVPRFAQLVMIGVGGSSRHENDKNDYRNKGKENAIEISLGAQFMFVIVPAHYSSELRDNNDIF